MDSSVTDIIAETCFLFLQVFANTLTHSHGLKVKKHNTLDDEQLQTSTNLLVHWYVYQLKKDWVMLTHFAHMLKNSRVHIVSTDI
jgi:hypothetical protein